MKILGIDLAAKPENDTGMAFINGKNMYLSTVFKDNQIIRCILQLRPDVIFIDAPLSLPEGRCCLEKECECSVAGHFRQSEREIRKYGPVFPLTFKGMKTLTFRGIGLKKNILKYQEGTDGRFKIMETHPRTSQKIFGFIKDKKDKKSVFKEIMPFFKINKSESDTSQHEIDAALAALVGFFYLKDQYEELGDTNEGTIIVPIIKNNFQQDMEKWDGE